MIFTNLGLAWSAVTSNVMRSILTCLGIVIGVGAVIAMISIGEAATLGIKEGISSLGRNMVIVFPGTRQQGGISVPAQAFRQRDVDAIRQQVPSVADVAPVTPRDVQAVYGPVNAATPLWGTDMSYFAVRPSGVSAGRLFTEDEVRLARPVCVIGETPRQKLFEDMNPVGEVIRVGQASCEIVGVLEARGGAAGGDDQDNIILAPIGFVQRRIAGDKNIYILFIASRTEQGVERMKGDLTALLRERRKIGFGEENDFEMVDLTEIADTIGQVTGILTVLLSSVAGISLLVGGIGIMNVMLVSVTERTREIGIRLSIGALERDVLWQFLVEAALLALLGGLVGIGLGLGLSWIVTEVAEWPLVINWGAVGIAAAFSALIGIVFGFFPARQAARLDPIEALRYE